MTPLHPDVLDIDDIVRSGTALADLLDGHDATTPVPSCGDWTLGDLVWHLTEVQLFWIHAIEHRPEGPETYERPARPGDTELAQRLRTAGNTLVELLGDADVDDHAWSWSGDHSVGFTMRRQIHEALIHWIDGVLAVGGQLPAVHPLLAADGIDEMVQVMLTGTPEWAVFHLSDDVVELCASDTDDQWIVRAGTVTGTPPESDREVELAGYELDDSAIPTATIEAPAVDLLLWMWGRGQLDLQGSATVEAATTLRQAVVSATQ